VVAWSVIGCLILAGLGVGLSLGRSPSSSGSGGLSAGSSAVGSSSAESSAVAAPNASAPTASASSSSASASFAGTVPFLVTASGTRYEAATLAAQVRARLHVPATSGGAAAGHGSAPTAALRGCVVHLTGGLPPRLVDRATYQGDPAYVIASSSHVWVVGPGCTAANPELITSAALAG
jgi:hypothetical protein